MYFISILLKGRIHIDTIESHKPWNGSILAVGQTSINKCVVVHSQSNTFRWTNKLLYHVLIPRWHGYNIFIALTSNKYATRPYKSSHYNLFHVNACSHRWFKPQSVFLHAIYRNRPTPYVGCIWFHTDGREPGHTNLLISRCKDRWEQNSVEIRNLCMYH